MFIRKCTLTAVFCLLSLLACRPALAYYTDAPHNEASGIYCQTCHADPAYSYHVPGNIDDTLENVICLRCHGPQGVSPQHKLHSDLTINGTENWTTSCMDCHDPHFQDNVRAWAGIDANAFLVTGTIGGIITTTPADSQENAAYPDGTTTISYSQVSAQPGWTDPGKWASKGGYCNPETAIDNSRGLIFIRNYTALGDTFEIVDADGSTITIKGQMAPASGLKFALVYGQLIRSYMLDANGNGGKYIKLFSPINKSGADNGFVDDSGANEPIGICQVCHPQTMKYWNTDNSGNTATAQPHGQNFPCSSCHKHAAGFASGADHGQFMSDTSNCLGCHTTYNEVETGHPLCDSCHTTATPYMNNLQVRYEAKGVHDVLADSYGFDANDRLLDTNGVDIHDPSFISITCLACHINKADWKNHDPNNETHPVNVLATTDNTCETCHGGLNWPYNTPADSHYNNGNSCALCHNSVDGSFIGSAANHTLGLTSDCKKCHGVNKHDPAPAHTSVYEGGQKNISEPATTGGCTNISCHGGEGFGSSGNTADILSGHLDRKTVTFPQGMDCQSCHTAGSKLDDANIAAVIATGSTSGTSTPPSCADCHGAQIAPHGITDHTVAGAAGYIPITVNQECIICHTTYLTPGTAHITSCATCHNTGADLRSSPDLAQFAGSPTSCTDCHSVAGVKQHGMTPAEVGGIHTISSSSTMNCVTCHSTMGDGIGQLTDHMYRSNDCQTCHGAVAAASGANAINIITAATSPDTNLAVTCEQCHAVIGDYRLHGMSIIDVGNRHDISSTECQSCHDNMADGAAQLTVHMNGGDCLTCHNASDTANGASATGVILKATMRNPGLLPGETDTNAPVTCEQCHVVKGDYRLHGLTVTDSHDAHDNTVYEDSPSQETVESGNCGNCHSAFNNPNLAMNHIALPTTSYPFGMDCQGCHNYTGSKLSLDIRAVIDAGIASNTNPVPASCADCHGVRTDPHPATPPNDHLDVADNGYAPITANAECTICHSDNITQLHLYKCSTCHSSNMPDLAATPFDLQQFAASTTACVDCHDQAKFPAIKAHGLTAAEVGSRHTIPAPACQGCHTDMIDGDGQLSGHMPTGDCMKCHGAADTANNTSATAIITAATAPLDNLPVVCEQCHAVKGDYKLHGLDAATAADIHNNTGFDTIPATLTCTSCHADMSAIVAGHLDLTATATFTSGMNCVDCHNYTGGKLLKSEIDSAITNAQPLAASPATALCADCHGGTRPADHPNVDHTVIGLNGYIPLSADSQCINCHSGDTVIDIHANTCATCHSNAIPALSSSPFTLSQFAGSSTSCTDCHNSATFPTIKEHGLTPATVGSRHNMSSANCQGCHSDMPDGTSQLNLHMPAGDCLLCHSAADTSNNTSATGVIDTATAPDVNLAVTCDNCHAVKGDYKLHGLTLTDTTDIHTNTDYEDVPSQELVQNGQCAGCHAAFKSPNLAISHFAMSSTPSYASGMDCFGCHNYSAGGAATISKSWVDAAIAAGVKSNPAATPASCADCHGAQADPHPTTPANDHLDVTASGYAPITASAECVNCHGGGISHIHSYNCQMCHDSTMPYLSTSPHNLSQFAGSTTSCLDCHDTAKVPGIKEHGITSAEVGSRHKMASSNCQSCHDTMADGKAQLDRHMIITNDCLTCHQAASAASGASAIDQIAAAIAPQTNTQVNCEQCHVSKGDYRLHGLTAADTIDIHNNTHTLTSTPASEVNNPNLNCAACHNDVAAPNLSAGHIALPNVTSYANGMDCQSCHNYTEGGKANMNKAAIAAAINAGQSDLPADLVECADCHGPLATNHGGHPTPDTFIRQETNCTACHDAQGDRDYITDIHNRRAASHNLTNCQVCHQNPNGGVSLQDYSISGGVLIPGDKVNYITRTNGNGGTCLTCHNNSGGGATLPYSQSDDFSNLNSGQAAGAIFTNWTEVSDINGTAQWMIWNGATATTGTGPSSSSGEYVVLESSPATAACTVDPAGTYIEAENYENIINPDIYAWSAATGIAGANGGKYLQTTSGSTALTPQGARADYTVLIPADGTYQISMRLQDGQWNGAGGDSTMWGVDGSLVGIITETTNGIWTWTSNEHAPSNKVSLTKGVHTINLWPREKDQLTDAFILWDTANKAPVKEGETNVNIPTGITQLDPTNCGSNGDSDSVNGSDLLTAASDQYLESNTFDAAQYVSLSINFDYNMNIADNADAVLSVAGWDGVSWQSTTINTGNSGDIWANSGTIDFIGYTNPDFKIRIGYRTGTGTLYLNDIGLDNIVISGDINTVGDGSRYHPAFIHNTITDNTANCTTTCHTESNSITGTHKVSGVDSTDCYKCHQSDDPAVIQAIYNGSDGTAQTCGNCHGSYTDDFANSHTVIGDTHAAMITSNPTCATTFCHPGDVQVDVHNNNCNLCHVDTATNNGTLQGTALNHVMGIASDCSQCHINRDSDHTSEHDNSFYEDSPSQEDTSAANSVSGQCDSCHSFMGNNGTGYTNISTAHVGLALVSKDITGSENNEDTDGIMTCATCHRSQVQVVIDTIAAGRSSAANPANASCADCHGIRTLPHGGHDYTHFSSDSNCADCHTGTSVTADIHNNDCLLCHDNALGGDDTTIIEGDPANGVDGDAREASKLADFTTATCSTCHDGAANTNTSIDAHHGASKNNYYANEQCASCHVNSGAEHDNTDFEDNPSQEDPAIQACMDCHELFTVLPDGHVGRSVISNDFGTPVGTEIDCKSCHESSDTTVTTIITNAAGDTPTEVPASCADCHTPRSVPHGGHLPDHFIGSTQCTGCHITTASGITEDFHQCDDCHELTASGYGAVKIGDAAGGVSGDATRAAALADYRTASCMTCHGSYMTVTTTEGAGGTRSATTYGGAHHNEPHTQAGDCDYCHDDPRRGPDTDWESTFGLATCPQTLPKQLACIGCHIQGGLNQGSGWQVNEQIYQWSGTAERSKINSVANVKIIHQIDSLNNQPIKVYNYGICLGCHNQDQKGRPINVLHARPVTTNMWANGTDNKKQGSTQIDNLLKAAGFNNFRVFSDDKDKSLYPAIRGGIGNLKDKYDKIYKDDDKLADYVKSLKPGAPKAPYDMNITVPCGSFNDWEGQCKQVGSATTVKLPYFSDIAAPGPFGPSANNDTYTVNINGTTTLNITANDTGTGISLQSIGSATGTVQKSGNSVLYTPVTGHLSTDSFSYTIVDTDGITANGTVSITIVDPTINTPPVANDDSIAVAKDSNNNIINVLANDSDPDSDPLTVSAITAQAAHGVCSNQTTTVNYSPTAGYTGSDSCNYQISDGRGGTTGATINITVNDGVLSSAGGNVVGGITPFGNYGGGDSVTIDISTLNNNAGNKKNEWFVFDDGENNELCAGKFSKISADNWRANIDFGGCNLNDGLYFLEMAIEDDDTGEKFKIKFIPFTIGNTGEYIKVYSDDKYSNETTGFGPNDRVYVEINSAAFDKRINGNPDAGGSEVKVASFKDTKYVDKAKFKTFSYEGGDKYRLSFDLDTNTGTNYPGGGYLYQAEMKANGNSKNGILLQIN